MAQQTPYHQCHTQSRASSLSVLFSPIKESTLFYSNFLKFNTILRLHLVHIALFGMLGKLYFHLCPKKRHIIKYKNNAIEHLLNF
jgi:hypothetical protein